MHRMVFKRQAAGLLLSCAASWSGMAQAHVGLEWPVAMAGTPYKATFQIGHGCGASPTRQVVVEIPAGVLRARPMPRPGWTVEVQRAPLAQPRIDHGRTVTEEVARITWTARSREDMLDTAHYDEFVVHAQLPSTPGPLYWPVRQICPEGRHDWVEVPSAGRQRAALAAPAPVLELLPAGPSAPHAH